MLITRVKSQLGTVFLTRFGESVLKKVNVTKKKQFRNKIFLKISSSLISRNTFIIKSANAEAKVNYGHSKTLLRHFSLSESPSTIYFRK